MKKKELMALLKERESFIENLEIELKASNRIITDREKCMDLLRSRNNELYKQNTDLTNENKSLKRSLESKEGRISDTREELKLTQRRANELWETSERLSRELEEVKNELNRTRSGNDTLLGLVKTLQPKENQKPVKCEKGEWCAACQFNKKYAFKRDGITTHMNICMKNCSCNNFVVKED